MITMLPQSLLAGDVIHWLTADNPPIYIYRGGEAGRGVGDQQLAFLQNLLPEYEHRTIQADSARISYALEHDDAVCVLGALKSFERERVAQFSNRPNIVPGYRLLILADRRAYFSAFLTEQGEIDLGLLASNDHLRGAYVAGRPQFGSVEDFIKSPERKTSLEKMPQAAPMTNLLAARHIDFAFAPGFEINYLVRRETAPDRFLAIPIHGMPALIRNYVACSDRPIGRRIIAQINQIIDDDQKWPSFLAPLAAWDDEAAYRASLAAVPEGFIGR